MAVQYLSQEWATEVTKLLQADEAILKAGKGRNVTIQQVVTGTPNGDHRHFLRVTDGLPEIVIGDAEKPDATVSQSYETSVALDKGELDPQAAFFKGQIKVLGNLLKLMQMQSFLMGILEAVKPLEREY